MKICLLTPGQPSTNPRLVKEADALVEAGYEVHVLSAYWAPWAKEADKTLLERRTWACTYVGGDPLHDPLPYVWSRIRHGLSRRGVQFVRDSFLQRWALCRVTPELERAAKQFKADLYVAHNLGALPAAVEAAHRTSARVGFDAEDFHTSRQIGVNGTKGLDCLKDDLEKRYLPQCDYMTASSPEIAEAYAEKYEIPKPLTILNVFPLSQRPEEYRTTRGGGPLTLYWFSQTIGPRRGLEDVIQAMGILKKLNIELHLRGNLQKDYKKHLLRFAVSLGLKPEQVMSHTPAPPDEMVGLASQYDVGLALEPGRDENNQMALSNKLFTYLLAGNAIIATRTRAQKAVMETISSAGYCYDPGDVANLASQLKRWFEDRASLERARREAWNWGTQRYNWDIEKQKFLEVVRRTLSATQQTLRPEVLRPSDKI